MSSLRLQDRVSLCRFTFADGRQCALPAPRSSHFCFDHARRNPGRSAVSSPANCPISSRRVLSANDLSAALGCLVPAVVAATSSSHCRNLAYLAQTLIQTIHLASTNTSTPLTPTIGAMPSATGSTKTSPTAILPARQSSTPCSGEHPQPDQRHTLPASD